MLKYMMHYFECIFVRFYRLNDLTSVSEYPALGLLPLPGPGEAAEHPQGLPLLCAQGRGLGRGRPGVQRRQDVLLAQQLKQSQ